MIAAVVVIGNSDLLLGKATPIWDAAVEFGPMFYLLADHSKAGRLILWDPWINGGSPDFAEPQNGATSPLLLVYGLLSTNSLHGFVAYWITIWIFGGIGMLLLCRHLQSPAWGGLVSALGFVACGFYTGHGEHTAILYSFSFLPWILLGFDIALRRRSYWNMVVAGVLWGVSALGGYPALTIATPIFLGLWGLGRSWLGSGETECAMAGGRKSRLLFTVAGLCMFCLFGAAVMSPSYAGFLIYAKGYTSRAGGISRDFSMVGPLPPQALGTFASPFLYLLSSPPFKIWPETDISMSNVYMGALVVSLAAISLLRVCKWRLWVVAIIVFFFSCAVGNHLPIRGWLYDLLPPTRYFRMPSLFSAYAIVGVCILAAYGSGDLDKSRISGDARRRGRFVIVSGLVTIVAALAYLQLLRTAHLTLDRVIDPSKIFMTVWLSIIVIIFLWWKGKISSGLLLVGLLLISMYDATSAIKTSRPTMYSEASAGWWDIMTSKHVKSLDLTSHGLGRELYPPEELGRYPHDRGVALKIPVFAADAPMVNTFFKAYVADQVLNRIAVGTQRIWFSDHPVWLPLSENAFADYVRVSHAVGLPPLVLHSPEDMLKGSASTAFQPKSDSENWVQISQPMSPATIELLKYTPNCLSFRYNASEDGWLLVTDRWAQYWNATVNDRSVQIFGGNFIFRAIPVSRGENTVLFRYEPRGYLALVILSWGMISLVALLWIIQQIVSRR
jgi:hypothetical protein